VHCRDGVLAAIRERKSSNDAVAVPQHNGVLYGIIAAMKNFHLPLPEKTYAELQAEAARARVSTTAAARNAISAWLQARKKLARRRAIIEYAAAKAGTRFDLDPLLEAAGIEELMVIEQASNK
jgi:hypothetical protein